MSIKPKQTPVERADESQAIRNKVAKCERDGTPPKHVENGDEKRYPNKLGSYTKGLPHDNLGRVDLAAYNTLMTALQSGKFDDFEKITLGGVVPLVNPQAGLAYDLEGTDSHQLMLPPGPAVASPEKASMDHRGLIVVSDSLIIVGGMETGQRVSAHVRGVALPLQQ